MTRRREKVLNAKSNPVALFAARIDLSDVASRHRVTNATTPSGSLSLIHEWRGCTHRPGSLAAFALPSFGIRC